MANVIQDIYRLDVDPNSGVNIAKLAQSVTVLDKAQLKAGRSADQMAKDELELTNQTKQLNAAINQEVTTISGLQRKQDLLRESLKTLTIGSREYNTVQKELNKTNQSLDSAFGKSSGVISSLKGAVTGLIGPYIGVAGAIAIVTKSIQSYAEKEALINQLSLVLNGNEKALNSLVAQADKIESLTLFDDDDILKAQQFSIASGRTVEETEKLIGVATDLAAVRKISVNEATKLLIDGEDGYYKQLRKNVPEIRNFTDEQIKAGIATEELGKKIKGAAEGLATGTAGALNNIFDKLNNAEEAFGRFFTVKIPAFLTVLGIVLSEGFLIAVNRVQTFFGQIQKLYLQSQAFFGKDVKKALLQNREDLADLRDEYNKLGSATAGELFNADVARRDARAKAEQELKFSKVAKGGAERAAAAAKEVETEIQKVVEGSIQFFDQEIAKQNKILQEQITAGTSEALIKGTLDAISKAESGKAEITSKLQALRERIAGFTATEPLPVALNLIPTDEDIQKQIASLREKVGTELKKPDGKGKTPDEILGEIITSTQDIVSIFSDAIVSPFEQASQRLDQLVDKQRNAYENALANSENFNDAQIEVERKRLEESEADQRSAAEKTRTLSQIQVAAYTAIAIARAVAEGGAFASFATVTAVLAALAGGLAQIGSITQGFHDGSDFVTGKRGRDKIPAMIEYGEAVIQADANEKYHPLVKDIRRKTKHADFALKALEASKSGQAALGYQIFNDFSPLVTEQKKTNRILREQSSTFKNTRIRVA